MKKLLLLSVVILMVSFNNCVKDTDDTPVIAKKQNEMSQLNDQIIALTGKDLTKDQYSEIIVPYNKLKEEVGTSKTDRVFYINFRCPNGDFGSCVPGGSSVHFWICPVCHGPVYSSIVDSCLGDS